MGAKTKLSDFSPEEQGQMPYADLCALRCAAYETHVAGMAVPAKMEEFAAKIEYQNLNSGDYDAYCDSQQRVPNEAHKAEWAKTLGVWVHRVSVLAAFMVVRWGEEPSEWPAAFTDDDLARTETWLSGKKIPGPILTAIKNGV